jgi:pyruvate/2-oxoglutarate dehydrogenase complex dihydrolipoamide acyltransferase (E2) component
MSVEVRVPTLGESVTEATVATWFKKPGDAVAVDEMLCELETDKVTVEVPAPAAGTLGEIIAQEGETVGVDALLGMIAEGAGAATPAPAAEPAPVAAGASVDVMVPTLGESVTEATVSTWFKAVGDTVAQDEMLCELETDKVSVEVPAPAAGVLAEIVAPEGATVDASAKLAVISSGAAGAAPSPVASAPAPVAASAAAGKDVEDAPSAKKMMAECNCQARIIAKIERAEALNNIEEIIEESDVIMIARGDLGVEIGDAALPPVQKSLIKMARDMDRAVITATQMMESMIENKIPTRAEVFDVANAVIDGTDAVMLSGETSIGRYPDKAVEAMSRICDEAEKQRSVRVSDHRINQRFENIAEAIAMSSMYSANHIGAKAICTLTETGGTCLWMSRISSGIPIFAFTRHTSTRRRVAMYRGVYPIKFDITHTDPLEANKEMIDILLEFGAVEAGDFVIITKGDLRGRRGGTNNMKIIQVGQALEHMI